jgi:hypothetical protein
MLAFEAGALEKLAGFWDPKNMQEAIAVQQGSDVGWGEAAVKSVGTLGLWNLYRQKKRQAAETWQRENNMSLTNDPNDPKSYMQAPTVGMRENKAMFQPSVQQRFSPRPHAPVQVAMAPPTVQGSA